MSKYYVLEGIDGSGKTTQADRYPGCVMRVTEPDEHNPVGRLLRKILKSGEHPNAHAALFLADRLILQHETVGPLLERGHTVVSDRCFLSTLVYQQENWPLEYLFSLHRALPIKPDHLIILDLEPEESQKRINTRGQLECYEQLDILKRNRQRYLELARDYRMQQMVGKITVVDASGTPDQVAELIQKAISHG